MPRLRRRSGWPMPDSSKSCGELIVPALTTTSRAAAQRVFAAARIAFHALEEGQYVLIAPAAVAQLCPSVEVLRLAADEDHAVDRARAAEQFAAWHREAAAIGACLRFGRVEPVG